MAYITRQYLENYAYERNYNIYQYPPADIDASIIVAADFIDAYYEFKTPLASMSPLPDAIQKANAMAAIMHLEGLLLVDNSAIASGVILSEEGDLKGIKGKVVYQEGTAQTYKRNTPMIDNLLKPYLVDQSGIQAFSVGRRC